MIRLIKLLVVVGLVAAAMVGCGQDGAEPAEAPQNLGGGTSTTADSPLTIEQVEREAMQFQPEMTGVTCSESEAGSFSCEGELDGREIELHGTPTEDGVGFVVAGPGE
jgi:hypothetical protein